MLYTFIRDGESERMRDTGWHKMRTKRNQVATFFYLLERIMTGNEVECVMLFFRGLLCAQSNNIQVWIYTYIRIKNHQQEIYKITACYWHRARAKIPIDICIRDRAVWASATSLFTRSRSRISYTDIKPSASQHTVNCKEFRALSTSQC